MAGRERKKLTEAAIARFRPREREYTVWDNRVADLGVRVRPSGGKSYVLLLDMGRRTKRVSLGPVSLKTVDEARRECQVLRMEPKFEEKTQAARPVPLLRDFVAGPWKEAHFDNYKPSTKKGVRHQLAAQLLPAFGAKPLDRIGEAGIRHWFDRYSRTAPRNANLTLERLRQILNFAIACGHIENNPATGIALNRRPPLTRFLSREELGRLHAALDAEMGKGSMQQADIIRLLLLTGCRKSEIVNLYW
ncbi:MAG: integrase arm-type DNA-binding domain-containing protein, partial [Alphaproteobacteria bacterium]|nr:integrase arm-type DNA-binding domain-containing protein [Alphaproteobacteria bacterium]